MTPVDKSEKRLLNSFFSFNNFVRNKSAVPRKCIPLFSVCRGVERKWGRDNMVERQKGRKTTRSKDNKIE